MGHLTDAQNSIQTVLAQIQADWQLATGKTLVIELDNRDVVDQGTQQDVYLSVEIIPMNGEQADMADRPKVLQEGQILLSAVARCGSGASESNVLLDFLTPYFDMKDLANVRCHAVKAVQPKEKNGWRYAPAIVDYWYHRTS